jgi:hypothetical protein
MKTPEEIEKIANIYCIEKSNIGESHDFISYVDGYTQCQKDIIKELTMHVLINEHDWNRNPQAQLKDFIKSLNKQG